MNRFAWNWRTLNKLLLLFLLINISSLSGYFRTFQLIKINHPSVFICMHSFTPVILLSSYISLVNFIFGVLSFSPISTDSWKGTQLILSLMFFLESSSSPYFCPTTTRPRRQRTRRTISPIPTQRTVRKNQSASARLCTTAQSSANHPMWPLAPWSSVTLWITLRYRQGYQSVNNQVSTTWSKSS